MDAKQFGWLYMVQHGQGGCRHNHYGGWKPTPDAVQQYQPRGGFYSGVDMEDLREKMLAEVRRVGVDWNRTADVQSDSVSEFTDTFHDPTHEKSCVAPWCCWTVRVKSGQLMLWKSPTCLT
jgi:hypothetical protein